MNKTASAILLTVLLLTACRQNPASGETSTQEAVEPARVELLADGKLRYLELSGTAYERGVQHGTLLKKEIAEVVQKVKADVEQKTGQEAEQYINGFIERTGYLDAIKQISPELLEELRGISDGSEIDFNTLLFHQLPDEYWKDLVFLQEKCSSFGVDKWGDRPSMTAQNMDIPEFYHGYQTVLKITEPSGKKLMLLTIPGVLGISGMNNRGVSVNVNTLLYLNNSTKGLPVTFIVRKLAESDTQEEALRFLKTVEHASGQNYILGGPEKVYDFECSALEKAEYRPFEGAPFTYHTNHPLANTDYAPLFLADIKEAGVTLEQVMVCQRFPVFQQRFTSETTAITVEDIKDILRSRANDGPDVVSNQNTYASVIYILGESPEFLIAPGKPHEVDYVSLTFE
jgi:hypothetical protein